MWPDYEHVRCDCGGIIAVGRNVFDRDECSCDRCGKIFNIYELKYDRLKINKMTGCIFPVLNREDNHD